MTSIAKRSESNLNDLTEAGSPRRGRNKVGLLLMGITGGAAVALSVIAAPFVAPALRKVCLPYVPATSSQVNHVLKALQGRSGRLVDLGSGDGRIVIAAARESKLPSVGVELNPWLVLFSRMAALRAGVSSSTSFVRKDLFKFDLSSYDNVVIFGVEEMMALLEDKLETEVPQGRVVVACRFPLPSWTPIAEIGEGVDTVWIYKRPAQSFTSETMS